MCSHTEEVETHLEMASIEKVHMDESIELVAVSCVLTVIHSPCIGNSLLILFHFRKAAWEDFTFMQRIQVHF